MMPMKTISRRLLRLEVCNVHVQGIALTGMLLDEDDDEDEGSDGGDGDAELTEELESHRTQLNDLKSKDPKFYDYLMQTDKVPIQLSCMRIVWYA